MSTDQKVSAPVARQVPAVTRDALRTTGRPLDPATRAFMEDGFGHDFGPVRVHDDATADRAAAALGAQAFTVGNDVIFSAGRYSPTTPSGRWLLAHELTHVVQQSRATPGAQTVLGAGAAQEAEATHAAEALLMGRRAPVRLFSDRGAVMCRRVAAASPAEEALDEFRASLETATRGSYGREEAAGLVARAQKLNAVLEASTSPALDLACAESLVLLHSLLAHQLAAAPVDDKGVPQLDGLPPGTASVDSVAPFAEIDRWQRIVANVQAAQRITAAAPERARRSRRSGAATAQLPAPPVEGVVVSDKRATQRGGEPLTDGGEIQQAISAVGRFRVRDLRDALGQAAAGAGPDKLSGARLAKAGQQLCGLAADDNASLSSQVGHIVYIATRIYLLDPGGGVVGEDFAFNVGAQSLPPGVYFAFPGPEAGGRRATAKIDGSLSVGYHGDFRASYPLEGLFLVSDRLAGPLQEDFGKGRGFVIVTAPAVFGPTAVRPFANYGNLATALWRSKDYLWQETKRVYYEMKKEPDQAALDLTVQLGLEEIGKRVPGVGKVMSQYMLLVLADSLGTLAAIAIYARTDDELDLAAHGIARWVAEQAVQQALITGVHLGVAGTKRAARIGRPKAEVPALAGAKAIGKVPPPRLHLDAEQGAELLKAGGWKKYVEGLGPESAEAKHIEGQRDGLVAWLRERLGATDDEIVRTGTRKVTSDLDVNFYGPKAVERLYEARRLLQERFGWHPDALDLMLDMSLLVDSARAHVYTDKRLSRASRLRLQRHLESGARMRYLEALATRARESSLARAELERAAREWGIDPDTVKAKGPLSPHDFQEHFEAIEEMYAAHHENPSEDLAKHIVDAQIELNMRSEGAYYEPASIRERASRETGRAGGRLSLGEVFAEMLNQRVEFFARIAKAERALAGVTAGLSAARTAAERFQVLADAAKQYQLSKYAWRFLEMAERAGLPIDPELKAMANRIKSTKSIDGILLGPNELSGYVGALDHLQTEVLAIMESRLQSPDRTSADVVVDLRQRVWPLVTALENASEFLRSNSSEIDGILVHNAARVIVVQSREDRRPGIEEPQPPAAGEIQRKAASSGVAPEEADRLQPIVAEALDSPGQALDTGTREFVESGLGHDFSRVRIHADATAVASAGAVDALAYTVGHHVVFGAGRYAPGTAAGRHLLAHELTHVWQQSPNSDVPVTSGAGALQAKRADGPATPAEKAADAVADHVVNRPEAKATEEAMATEGESSQAIPGRLIPLAEAQKTRRILADDLFVPLGLRYALAAKPLDGLVVPDEGTLEQQQRRDEDARRVASHLHDAFANPPILEQGRKYTPSQMALVGSDAVKLLTSQRGDDRRAVLRRFQSQYGVTLRSFAIANLFPGAGRIEARKNLVRVLGYLEVGHVSDPVVEMGLALIPLGTRDEAIVGILQRVSAGQRATFAKRYARAFSGIGLTGHDTLEEHLRDDLSEYWNSWRLQQALAVLDHNLHPAEELYFNAKEGRNGDVVKQVQDTWRQGYDAFKTLEDDWVLYVNNGAKWTREAFTLREIGDGLYQELVVFGSNREWQLVRAVITAYRDTSIAKANYNIGRFDAGRQLRAEGYPTGAVSTEDAPAPVETEESIRLQALEASLREASGTIFTGTDIAQVESALADIAKIWAARVGRARASGDLEVLRRAKGEWELTQQRLSARLGSYLAGRGDIPLWDSDAQRARVALLPVRSPADEAYAHKLAADWQKCVEDVSKIWASGQIEQYRADAGVPTFGAAGTIMRPVFDPDYLVPPQSGHTDAHNRIVSLTNPRANDIQRGADRIQVEVSIANSDSDLSDLFKFLTTKGVDRQRRAEIVVQYVDDHVAPKPGTTVYDRFFATLVAASNEPRAAGGEGPNLLQIRHLLTPTTDRKELIERAARVEAASNTGALSKTGNALVEAYGDVTREDYGEIKREKFDRLKYVNESSDAEIDVLLSLTGANDRSALFQLDYDAFLASVESFKGIKKMVAAAAAGIVEVLVETALSAALGGAGIAAVFNTIAANIANIYTQELILGADYEAVSEENVRGVIQAGVGSFLFDVNDYRGKIAAIVNIEKTQFLGKIKTRWGEDVAKRSASLTQNVLAGLADNTVKAVVNLTVDSVLQPRVPTADAISAEAYKFFFNTLGRALHGPALTYKVNPGVIHDFQTYAERYRDTFIFKTGVKLTEGVTKKIAELAATDTSNMSWEEIFETIGISIAKGTVTNLTKSLGSAAGGARLASNRIAVVRRLFLEEGASGEAVVAAVARDPKYFGRYRDYANTVVLHGGRPAPPEEWLLSLESPKDAAKLHTAALQEAERRHGKTPQSVFSPLYFERAQ